MSGMRRRVRVLALMGLAALALAACGDSGDGGGDSEEQAVERADAALREAFRAGDAARYCGGLTEASAQTEGNIVSGTCEDFVRAATKNKRLQASKKRPKVLSVEVNGDKATVKLVIGKSGRPFTAPYVKRDGRWLGNWQGAAFATPSNSSS